MARSVTGAVQGLSTTPAALVQHLRLFQSALAGVSLTPDSQGELVRQLVSLLAGSSVTAASTPTVARALVALLPGLTQTPGSTVTTVHPLAALLLGTSNTPVSLVVPNSGEMALQAAVLGSSVTTGGRFVLIPMERVTPVPFAGRGTVLPDEGRLAVVGSAARTGTAPDMRKPV